MVPSVLQRCAGPVLPRTERTFVRPWGLTSAETAAHEAAHVLAAHFLGYAVTGCTIRPVERGEKRIEGEMYYVRDLVSGNAMHAAIVAIAGPLGEQLRCGKPLRAGELSDPTSDRWVFEAALWRHARKLGQSGDETVFEALQRIAIERAEKLLAKHFAALIELENQLLLRVSLDSAELAEILGPAPAKKR